MDLPTVALPRPDPARADPARADTVVTVASAGVIWYEAPSPDGRLRLRIAGPRLPARHAADAAIALQHCAPLLDPLDRWTGLDLAWAWAPAPPTEAIPDSGASATWRSGVDDGSSAMPTQALECRIDLPWRLLRRLPAPDPSLGERLQWSSLRAVLSVARLRLARDDIAQLEAGGAVLLPQSLQPNWHGVLRTLGESARGEGGVPVAMNPAGRSRLLTRSSGSDAAAPADASALHDDSGVGACEVRLAVERALPASHFTGWAELELGDVGPQASLWRCGSEQRAALCLAVGALMPWGDGWALALESVSANAAVEVAQIV